MEPLEGIYIQQVACGLGHTLFIARDEENDRALLDKIPVYDPDKVRFYFRSKRSLCREPYSPMGIYGANFGLCSF